MRLSVLRMKRRALVRRITFALATVLCLSGPAPSVADRTVPEELEYEVHEFTESPFGIHVFASSKETLEEDLPVFSATGARWTRTANLRFITEPEKGRYDWTRADLQYHAVEEAGALTITRLVSPVEWAASDALRERNRTAARNNAPMGNWTFVELPRDIESYRMWLTASVERYDGDGIDDMPGLRRAVHYWQIENEWSWRWIGTPDELVEFFRIASETIRTADAEATVVLGGMTGIELLALADGYLPDERFIFQGSAVDRAQVGADPRVRRIRALNEAILARGSTCFDVVSFHKYGDYQWIPACVAWLKDKMAAAGYSRPIISTEMGGPFIDRYEAYTEETHADAVVKYDAVSLASGVQQIYWSTLFPTPQWGATFVNTSLVNMERRKLPAYFTYKLLVEKLGDLRSAVRLPVEQWDTGTRVYKFETCSGLVYIMWSERVNGRHIDFPMTAGSVRQTDVAGSETMLPVKDGKVTLDLTTSPVFVEPVE